MRSNERVLSLFVLLALGGCRSSVGSDCSDADMAMARTVVYDATGTPAYAGQAIMNGSCAGGGSFCHSSTAGRRYGAPADMNFDLVLGDDARYADEASGAAALYATQLRVHHLRNDIYTTVVQGSMPPGEVGLETQSGGFVQYASASDTVGTPMPGLDTDAGVEMLRVWLACGSPVIEATTTISTASCRQDLDCAPVPACDTAAGRCYPVGAVEARHATGTTATWSSLYANILAPLCATAACHGAAGAALSGNLDMSTAAIAYAAMVNVAPDAPGCGTRVVPGDPSASFLVTKLEGTQDPLACGDSMPIGAMLPADQIALVRTWIQNGAAND